jgi:hypothetical protein
MPRPIHPTALTTVRQIICINASFQLGDPWGTIASSPVSPDNVSVTSRAFHDLPKISSREIKPDKLRETTLDRAAVQDCLSQLILWKKKECEKGHVLQFAILILAGEDLHKTEHFFCVLYQSSDMNVSV